MQKSRRPVHNLNEVFYTFTINPKANYGQLCVTINLGSVLALTKHRKTNNLFHYSCKFGTQTKKEEKMLTRIRVHFGNKMGGAGKGGIHFYKN